MTPDHFEKPGEHGNRRPMDQDDVSIILASSADLADSFRQYARETSKALMASANAIVQAADKITEQYEAHVRDLLEAINASNTRKDNP